ncbi:hypothetical protein OPT61_g5546 [Boeremia exigua]|uniref:Uncharacterized protein n=1 Tax=Boeremia exigua TaxID=749465 RepID=A0ACC2IA31_9PLEO|nr:hypothetical protein OPT61_g5546 [Boeremia exigua]
MMEQSLKYKEFILREVAPVHFLNEIISNKEWHVRIDESIDTLTVDGDSSPQVQYNALLRTLTWTNLAAEQFKIKSGVLQFDRTFTSCHGHVTTGSNLQFLVESVATSEPNSLQSTCLAAPPAYYAVDPQNALSAQVNSLETNDDSKSAEAGSVVPIEHGQDQLKQMALYVINQASQEVALASSQLPETIEISKQAVGDVHLAAANANPAVLDPKEVLDDAVLLKSMSTSTVAMTRYTTHKRPKGSTDEEDWDDGPQFGVGVEQQPALHTFVYLGENDITNVVTVSGDQDHYTKEAGVASHPDKAGFDITFGGFGKEKTFTGTYFKGSKEFEWKGASPTISYVDREGSNKPVVGSDGLTLNALLYSVTNLGKTDASGKSVDLAQKEADNILGRLMMGSVDQEISDMLFKDVFILTDAEKEIQKKGLEFLKRAGTHHVLKTIKAAEKVKQSIKDKINLDKCDRFVPMCVAPIAPATITEDPVFLYGLSRRTDGALVNQLQSEAQAVMDACSIAGYKIAVLDIQPYLKNAGEWYDILDTTLHNEFFIQDWMNKSAGSEGVSKTMYNLKKILDVLWVVTQASDEFKKKLKANISTPEQLNGIMNGAAYAKAQEVLAWDDTLRSKIKEVFARLDQVEKNKREQELADALKKQMIVDGAKVGSYQVLGETLIAYMEKVRDKATWTARDAQDALALAHASEAQGKVGAVTQELADAAKKEKGIQLKERWFSGARAVVTAVSIGVLTWVFSNKAASMEWYETLAMAGQLCEGFAGLHSELSALGKSLKAVFMQNNIQQRIKDFFAPMARWVHKYIFSNVAKFAAAVSTWLFTALPRIGGALITGIRQFASYVANGVKNGLITAYDKTIGRAVTFLKNLPIAWGNVFTVLCNVLSFGISALCLFIAIRDCVTAWRSGRTIDKVTSTISAVLVGLEVITLVVSGVAWLSGATAVVAACSTVGMVLGVVGIVFAVVLIIVAIATYEDPLDALVENLIFSLLYKVANISSIGYRGNTHAVVHGRTDESGSATPFTTTDLNETWPKKYHKDEDSVQCDVCQKTVGKAAELRRHNLSFHDTEPPQYHCQISGCRRASKPFDRKDKYEDHMKLVHPRSIAKEAPEDCEEAPHTSFPCSDNGCNRIFDQKADLLRHQRIHTAKSARPWKGTQCEQSFLYPKDLKRHEATHLDDNDIKKPTFHCHVASCEYGPGGQCFSGRDALLRHMKHFHSEVIMGKEDG